MTASAAASSKPWEQDLAGHTPMMQQYLLIKQQHPHGGEVTTVRNPIRMSDTPIEYRRAPPVCAQHTDEVLKELLSISSTEIDSLVAKQVIAVSPQVTRGDS